MGQRQGSELISGGRWPILPFQSVRDASPAQFVSVIMTRLFILLFAATVLSPSAWAQELSDDLVFVEGGEFQNSKANYGKSVTVSSFYIGKYEVTQAEWAEVMEGNPAQFQGEDLPIEMVSWYDCVEYCNKRSVR